MSAQRIPRRRHERRRGDLEGAPQKNKTPLRLPAERGSDRAGNETRTRDPDLGKVVLYQLSYSRIISYTPSIRGANLMTNS